MALLQKYRCPQCGFEIMAENSFHYGVMSGEYAYFKCSKCKEISTKRVPFGVDFPIMTPQYEEAMMEIKVKEKYEYCDKCGKEGTLTLWAPSLGCPKCRCKLLTDGIPMCVD